MSKDEAEKELSRIEKKMDKLKVEIESLDPIRKKASAWLVVSALSWVAGLVTLDFRVEAGLLLFVIACCAYMMHLSYQKEVTRSMEEIGEKSADLARKHLNLRVRSDPDGFIKSILEGTLND